jgi:MYXO-CTERM domain-containing protein
MNDLNDIKRETSGSPYLGNKTDLVAVVSDSARRARTTVVEHPYFTAGILAGLGAAIVGAIFATRRRRTLLDRVFDW